MGIPPIQKTSSRDLRLAREEFTHLLEIPTSEAVWQRFFAQNRFVLSRALPLRLLPCDVLPLGRPGRSEPDFILYPGSARSEKIHGVLELKTPHSRVLKQPRRTVLTFSPDATTAFHQVLKYDDSYDIHSPVKRTLAFQAMSHLFVVMGRASELDQIEASLFEDFRSLMRSPVRILTFDELFDNYSRGLPKSLVVLAPRPMPLDKATLRGLLSDQRNYDITLYRLLPMSPTGLTLMVSGDADQQALEEIARETQPDRRFPHLPSALEYGFRHPNPLDSRFRPADVAALYGNHDLETAMAEMKYHRGRFYKAVMEAPHTVQMRQEILSFSGRLAMLPNSDMARAALDPESYDLSIEVGATAIAEKIHGITYPSVRGRGLATILYKLDGLRKLGDGQIVSLHWSGSGWSDSAVS